MVLIVPHFKGKKFCRRLVAPFDALEHDGEIRVLLDRDGEHPDPQMTADG